MLIEERRQSAPVFLFHGSFPFSLSKHLLQHQRIDEGEADLDQMQREEGNFLVLWPIREEFAAFSMENKTIHTVPLLDDVERFLDFLPESSIAELLAQKEGFDHPPDLTECMVLRTLHITARKPPQNRIRIHGTDSTTC